MPPIIKAAKNVLESAQEELLTAVKESYPVGALVAVTIGRSRIQGFVIGHGSPWYDPSRVRIRNSETGAVRTFSATYAAHKAERLR